MTDIPMTNELVCAACGTTLPPKAEWELIDHVWHAYCTGCQHLIDVADEGDDDERDTRNVPVL